MTTYHTEQAIITGLLGEANGTTARLHAYLKNAQTLAEQHGRTWITPRAATMAEALGRCVRTIRRALAQLRQRGLLVVQTRYTKNRSGLVRQISNRLRVISTTAAALAVKAQIAERAKRLFMYRADIPVTPRTQQVNNKPQSLWITSPLYRSLMERGIKKRAPSSS